MSDFPLRWESTGDQWWYASPIDWAAANGHYDLVRELLRLDGNHLIKLTSLRRIRRLETVWDDEEQFHDVAKSRSEVARKLLFECEIKKGGNSLIGAGYGGWLLYTAASAGDLGFVRELLKRDPLLVFGEGEYGVTDILYAAARSKDSEVFHLVYDFAACPRFSDDPGSRKTTTEHTAEIPSSYKAEITNRALHAAARGGDLNSIKKILRHSMDNALAYRDIQGATILHSAAARGQVEVVKDLISSFSEITSSTDNHGNTALHVAAHRGHLPVVEAIILASPSSITAKNNAGDTFLHSVVLGFQTPGFKRLDRQIELMKQLLNIKVFKIEEIMNARNNNGRTLLHLAVTCSIHPDLVELLTSVGAMDVNVRDNDDMTPLDLLKQHPQSASSELLTRRLISAGGIFSSQDYSSRKVFASHIKKQSMGNSPGTSFNLSDTEIFLLTGPENAPEFSHRPEHRRRYSDMESCSSQKVNKSGSGSINSAANRLKCFLPWPRKKKKKLVDTPSLSNAEPMPIPLRQKFTNQSSLPKNKREFPVSSSHESPISNKKLASEITEGVIQSVPNFRARHRSRSSSFSKLSSSSQSSVDTTPKRSFYDHETGNPSISSQITPVSEVKRSTHRPSMVNNSLMNHFFCFGTPWKPVELSESSIHPPYDIYEISVLSSS